MNNTATTADNKVLHGTHSVKIITPRLKQNSVLASIIGALPPYFITSQTVAGKDVWAMPRNGADLPLARERIGNVSIQDVYLPDFQDSNLKQILLPYHNDYVSIAPVLSAKTLNQINTRLHGKINKKHAIAIGSANWGNHTDLMVQQHGAQRMFLTRVRHARHAFTLPNNCVGLSFRAESMNISGGMTAVGAPAITAIGGLVHAWERELGAPIEFAVGYANMNWRSEYGKGTANERNLEKSKRGKTVFYTDEIKGTADVFLILRTSDKSQTELRQFVMQKANLSRFAGGSIFDCQILKSGTAIQAAWLIDNNEQVQKWLNTDRSLNALDVALAFYEKPTTWGEQHTERETYSINQVGYAFLEQPTKRKNARNGYLTAWSEPIYGAIVLTDRPTQSPFWVREECENYVFWRNKRSE